MQTIEHRGFELEIHAPVKQGERWQVLAWPPSKTAPIVMLTYASGAEAIKEARASVDRILNGDPPPKP